MMQDREPTVEMKILIENSHIKGYHIYRVRPHKDIIMQVQNEEDNSYDPNSSRPRIGLKSVNSPILGRHSPFPKSV